MAKQREFKFGLDARAAIKFVAEKIGDVVGKTLGPSGRNYFLQSGITNDGKTIVKEMRFNTECEDLVAGAFEELAERQDRDGGDGTTTATVIGTVAAVDSIDKIPDLDTPMPGSTPVMQLSRQLEAEKNKAIELLSKKIQPVTTLEELERVAVTSMEDKANAKIVAKTIFDAGKDSFTVIDDGFTGKLETNITAGIKAPMATAAPFMFNTDRKEGIYDDVAVLVVHHVFEAYKEIGSFFASMQAPENKGRMNFKSLLIVAKQFSVPFVSEVAKVKLVSGGKLNILLVSNSNVDNDVFEDIAAFTNAELLDTHPKGGKKTSDLTFNHAGFVKKVVIGDKETVFIGGRGMELGNGTTTRVNERVLAIRSQLEGQKDPSKRELMEKRIAGLLGGIATIYVDAKTAAEKYYLKLKVQDAMNSCKHALEGGMIRGGGISLKEVAEELGQDSLLYNALQAPYRRIQLNNGEPLEIGEEVMDSYLVNKSAIENAVSVVKVLLTVEGVIAEYDDVMERVKDKILG